MPLCCRNYEDRNHTLPRTLVGTRLTPRGLYSNFGLEDDFSLQKMGWEPEGQKEKGNPGT